MTPPVTEIVLVVGPIEPATKRGRSGGRRTASAASRAMRAAATLISWALSSRPYSASTSGVEPKVSVSMMSAPASRKRSWTSCDDVGAGEDEVLVAAFELGAAEVVGGEVQGLDRGAHGAVEDEDALVEQRFDAAAGLSSSSVQRSLVNRQASPKAFGSRMTPDLVQCSSDGRVLARISGVLPGRPTVALIVTVIAAAALLLMAPPEPGRGGGRSRAGHRGQRHQRRSLR